MLVPFLHRNTRNINALGELFFLDLRGVFVAGSSP